MLRGFKSMYMSSVFRGPENEGGADADVDTGTDLNNDIGGADVDDGDHTGGADEGADGGADGNEDQGSKKPLTVREQLKKTIAEAQEGEKPPVKPKAEKKPKADAKAAVQGQQQEQAQKPAADGIAPPASLAKELHAEWANAPKAIKEAFIKREQDMQRGVEELKQKYSKIDEALAPHTDALREMNATPGEAVNRMFLWFKAISNNPQQAFPGLAKSLGFDWDRLVAVVAQGQQGQQGQQQQGQQGQEQQAGQEGQQPVIPEQVKSYIGQLEQRIAQLDGRFNSIQTDIQASNMAKTEENLSIWSKDKPYFQEVRKDMARMIETGLIPLKENGQVDLDTAYERAIHFNPEVRAKVLAEQQQANQQAQEEARKAATTAQQSQGAKARKAASSIPANNPPGAPSGNQAKKPGQKMSVRDSLKAALAELRDQ